MGIHTFHAALVGASLYASCTLALATQDSAVAVSGAATGASGLDTAAAHMTSGEHPDLLADAREHLQDAMSRWSSGDEVDEAEVASLEAELAFAQLIGPRAYLWRAALADLDFSVTAPTLDAAMAWLREDVGQLAPLSAWQFVGPFDNERGRGMNRPTPAEEAPYGGPYPGKVRNVDWRLAPAPGSDGVIFLGELIDPSAQSCLIARTWVRSDEERGAVLLIGATEELRVWWNGQPVYEALGLHDFGPDGHSIGVRLQSGWNEITLKVGGQDADPAFAARLVDPATGAPLRLESAATKPKGAAERELVDPGRSLRKGAGIPAPGGRAYFARQVDATSVLERSALAARAKATPRKERPGYQDAKAAHIAEPERLSAAMMVLQTIRVAGALDVEEDINPWLDVLNETIERHGPKAQLMAWYASFTAESQDLGERALELVEEALAADPNSFLARLGQVRYLYENGQVALAQRAARAIAADPTMARWPDQALGLSAYLPWTDPERLELVQLAAHAGDVQARRVLREQDSLKAGRRDVEAFLTGFREELTKNPYDIDHRIWAARRLMAIGSTEDALKLFDDALELCPESASLHSWRSRALLALGDTAGALEAITKSCEYDPSKADEQRLLEFLSTRPGVEGAEALAEASEGAGAPLQVRYAEPLEAIIARHPAAESVDSADSSSTDAVDAPREVLLHRQVVEVGADGKARRYFRTVQRVLSEAGVRQLDRRNFRAYPGAEDQRILSVRVLHPDGTIDEGQTGRGPRLSIDLPPLDVGDVVDIEWRRDDIQTSIFGNYFGLDAAFVPEPQLPTLEADITVLESPELKLYYHLAAGSSDAMVVGSHNTFADGSVETTWAVRDIMPRRTEALEPPAAESIPRIQASTYESWESFGRWWWSLIREEIATSPEMVAKVEELTGDKETREEKLRAIYDFVVTDIRYNAWEFGVHGYQPYSAPVIFSRRFGDCKDKAILMRAMLSEVGIEAWPVLIQSEGRRHEEDHELPLVAHFNHCIAYIPEQEGIPEQFLDGTARLHPLEVLPDSDRGAKVLTVRSDGAEQMRIAFPEVPQNEKVETITIDLAIEGSPMATFVQQPKGRWDPQLRYRFSTDDTQQSEAAESTMTQYFGAIQGDVTAEHPDYEDLTKPLTLTLSAQLERVGRMADNTWELPTSFAPYRLVQGIASESERTTDVLLDVPWAVDRTLNYDLPIGGEVKRVPDDVVIDTPDLGYVRKVSLGVNGFDVNFDARNAVNDPPLRIIIHERLELRTHRVPLERYTEFREAARQVDAAQRQNVAVEVSR
ncbi:DUF3857 domain-containing protein [Saltatorellus ferox]